MKNVTIRQIITHRPRNLTQVFMIQKIYLITTKIQRNRNQGYHRRSIKTINMNSGTNIASIE